MPQEETGDGVHDTLEVMSGRCKSPSTKEEREVLRAMQIPFACVPESLTQSFHLEAPATLPRIRPTSHCARPLSTMVVITEFPEPAYSLQRSQQVSSRASFAFTLTDTVSTHGFTQPKEERRLEPPLLQGARQLEFAQPSPAQPANPE